MAPVRPGGGLTTHTGTGIQILDDKLGGGFERPSAILLFSDHPSEKRLFAEQFLMTGIRDGERCVYVDFFRAPQLARRDLAKFGAIDESHLVFVDATSSQLLIPSTERYAIHALDDLDTIMDIIERAIRETKPARVVVDSMEFLADRFPIEHVLRRWRQLLEVGKHEGATVSYLFVNWTYGQSEIKRIEDMSDYVVEFESRMRTGILQHFLRIRHRGDERVRTSWIPYTFKELVGLTVYFPRILVTGPFNAGKSTVVRTLCKNTVSVDRMGTTVAFDYGNLELMGLEAEVFGTPGQDRFDFVFSIFAREVNGVLLVIDGTRTEDLPRARQMIDLVGKDVSLVILANKSDLAGGMTEDMIRAELGVEPSIPVIRTIATQGVGLTEALHALAEMIMGVR